MRKGKNAASVIKEIQAGDVAPVYLLYGEERYWHDAFGEALSVRFQGMVEILPGDETGWEDLRAMVCQLSFFGPRAHILKDAHLMPDFKGDPGIRSVAPGNCLVLSCPVKANPLGAKALSAWGKLGMQTVEATVPSFSEAVKWVKDRFSDAGLKASGEACENLVSITGRSIQRLSCETEKIRLYMATASSGRVTSRIVSQCVSEDPEKTAFGFVDAVAAKNGREALSEMAQLEGRGANPIMLLALLASHFVLLWRAKERMRNENTQGAIEKTLGVHVYSARKALKQSKLWTFQELEDAVSTLCRVDESIKTGRTDPSSGLRFAVLSLCYMRAAKRDL